MNSPDSFFMCYLAFGHLPQVPVAFFGTCEEVESGKCGLMNLCDMLITHS